MQGNHASTLERVRDAASRGTARAAPAASADVLKRILDLVGLPIDGVRANLHEPPVSDPFRAASGAG
jgi:hypothetical protein